MPLALTLFAPLPILYMLLLTPWTLHYTVLFLSIKSVPSFLVLLNLSLLSAELCW